MRRWVVLVCVLGVLGGSGSGAAGRDAPTALVLAAWAKTRSTTYHATERVGGLVYEVDADQAHQRYRIDKSLLVGTALYFPSWHESGRPWTRIYLGPTPGVASAQVYIADQVTIWQLNGLYGARYANGRYECLVDLRWALATAPDELTRHLLAGKRSYSRPDLRSVYATIDTDGWLTGLEYDDWSTHVSIVYSHLGEPVDVEAPAEADVQEVPAEDLAAIARALSRSR